jgi:hypothetical protein
MSMPTKMKPGVIRLGPRCRYCTADIPEMRPFIDGTLEARPAHFKTDERPYYFCDEACHFKWRKMHGLGDPREFGQCGHGGWCRQGRSKEYADGKCMWHSQDPSAEQKREETNLNRQQATKKANVTKARTKAKADWERRRRLESPERCRERLRQQYYQEEAVRRFVGVEELRFGELLGMSVRHLLALDLAVEAIEGLGSTEHLSEGTTS